VAILDEVSPLSARPVLSRAVIVAAATDLVAGRGMNELTVRHLAAELATGPASLYRHVSGIRELQELVLDEILARVEVPAPTTDYVEDLVGSGRCLRAFLLAHPGLPELLGEAAIGGPNAQRCGRETRAILDAAGFSPAEAREAIRALSNYTVGHVVLASVLRRHDPQSRVAADYSSEEGWERGIRALLHGLRPAGPGRSEASEADAATR
jgi:AcrR family transcriptional regulator